MFGEESLQHSPNNKNLLQSQMRTAILLCLGLILVGWATCSPFACNLTAIKNDFLLMGEIMNSLNDTRKPLQNSTDVKDKFEKIYQNLQQDSAVCWGLLMSQYVGETVNIDIPVFNDQCVLDGSVSPTAFKNDPCCNPNLQSNVCCKRRLITRRVKVAKRLTNAVENCTHPLVMKKLIRRATRDFAERKNICQGKLDQSRLELQNAIESMQQCMQNVVSQDVPCKEDSQCESNFCDPATRLCFTQGRIFSGNSTNLVGCILESLPETLKRAFFGRYNILGNFTNEEKEARIARLIAGEITTPQCLDRNFLPIPNMNMTNCQNKTVCNDYDDTNAITGRCSTPGGFCATACRNGICQRVLLNQALCENMAGGICYKNGYQPFKANQTECAKNVGCTDPRCYTDFGNNCNATACAQYGKCNGYPFEFDFCAFPKTNNNGVMMCPLGTVDLGQNMGCKNPAYTTKAQCDLNNGKWVPQPRTRQQCEGIQLCFDRRSNQFSAKSPVDCAECGGVMKSPFKWQGARWEGAVWRDGFVWKTRTQLPVNKIVDAALDDRKFGKLLEDLMDVQSKMTMKNTLFCLHNPQLSFFKVWLQDCGPVRENIEYFLNGTMAIGEIPAFNGTVVEQDLMDVFVRLGNGTVATEEGEVKKIMKKMLLWESEDLNDPTSRAAYFSGPRAAPNAVYVVDNNTNIGQVMGDGISVECTSCDLTLCLKLDKQIAKVSDSLNIPAFAYQGQDGKFYKDATVSELSDQTDQICGKVSQQKTYYPAFVTNGPIPPPAPGPGDKPASAMSLKLSFALLAIAALFLL